MNILTVNVQWIKLSFFSIGFTKTVSHTCYEPNGNTLSISEL